MLTLKPFGQWCISCWFISQFIYKWLMTCQLISDAACSTDAQNLWQHELFMSYRNPDPFNALTLIPTWINNHIHYKVWEEIPYSFLNGCMIWIFCISWQLILTINDHPIIKTDVKWKYFFLSFFSKKLAQKGKTGKYTFVRIKASEMNTRVRVWFDVLNWMYLNLWQCVVNMWYTFPLSPGSWVLPQCWSILGWSTLMPGNHWSYFSQWRYYLLPNETTPAKNFEKLIIHFSVLNLVVGVTQKWQAKMGKCRGVRFDSWL